MRIDLTQVATAAVQAEGGKNPAAAQPQPQLPRTSAAAVVDRLSTRPQAAQTQEARAPAKPTPLPQPSELNVSLDEQHNVIYRFTDPASGELLRQVPPEEILKIMRNIENLLHESEQQKIKVTL